MSLPNIVRTANGITVARFLSSIDARSFACANCTHAPLTVQDMQGGITQHKWDGETMLPVMVIETHGHLAGQSLINSFVDAVKYVRVIDNTRLFPEGRPKLVGDDLDEAEAPSPVLRSVE